MDNQFQFPTEVVDLPSKGLLYPKDSPLSSGTIEMKYMTAKEEDILTNQNYIQKGTVVDNLLRSLIVDKTIKYGDILVGDKNALLVAARILGYGKDYEFDYLGEKQTIDLSQVGNVDIDYTPLEKGENKFQYTLPSSGVQIEFKHLTHSDTIKIDQEIEGLKKVSKDASPELSTRLKHMLVSVNGSTEQKDIRNFVDNFFLARDSRAFREHIKTVQPDVDLTFYPEGGPEGGMPIPIGVSFLWPDAGI